jgi:hypothetical protein
MSTNRLDSDKKQNVVNDVPGKVDSKENPEKKKNIDDDTRNTGFRSSRIRDKESRTSDTGDPSVS